jgi:hypothetical protein
MKRSSAARISTKCFSFEWTASCTKYHIQRWMAKNILAYDDPVQKGKCPDIVSGDIDIHSRNILSGTVCLDAGCDYECISQPGKEKILHRQNK